MAKNLVIVESPAKAKTIAGFLGADFAVKSSIGHIRGIPSKSGSVDVENNFTPKYEVDSDKKKVIAELKTAVKGASTVWLASDEDREGEAIAWHISEVLKLDPAHTRRIAFHEITKPALERAIENPREIDMPLVEAQQARQTLDYLVGFELSPVLWRKVRPQLSAGRVQSVAVRLVVEREREIEGHKAESSFKITAEFKLAGGEPLNAESPRKYTDSKEVEQILQAFTGSTFTVDAISKKPGSRNPSIPFTTSTLQQEASSKLGYSPRATMQLAQRLYEAGLITYMRTDSPNLSPIAVSAMGKYIKQEFGEQYYHSRNFAAKSAGAQEAHEAIRPTDVTKAQAGADGQQTKLYNLIWRRTLASQMAAAKLERTVITIKPSGSPETLEARGEIVVFDGFLKVYGRSGDDSLLPPLKNGDNLELVRAVGLESLSRGPARYTEATLVRKLEEMGIGRPSTYASTISTIQGRGYVERGEIAGQDRQVQKFTLEGGKVKASRETISYGKDSNKLFPTDTGKVVNDFLVKYFGEVVDYDFTKTIEAELDDIAESKKNRVQVLKDFYGPFHKLVEASADISRADASQSRLIGKDPKSGMSIYARYGRYGPVLQLGEADPNDKEAPKPKFAPLPAGTEMGTITLKQALPMFELPREVGKTDDGRIITADIGRFGPYVKVDKSFYSLKDLDPFSITETEARQVIKDKQEAAAKRVIADFGKLQILRGPYGPYITDGKKNARVPKDQDPEKLDEATATKMLAEAPAAKRRNFRRRPAKPAK